jgi:hypothetical protein
MNKECRSNLIHRTILNAKPEQIISVRIDLPAGLLKKQVKTYGDVAKTVKTALKLAQKNEHFHNLKELISELRKYLELLEEDRSLGETDEVHNLLIETYRDCYLRLKGAEILRRRRKA